MIPFLASATASNDNRIIIGGSISPSTLDPAESWDDASSYYINGIYEKLVQLNPKTYKIDPALAVSWTSSDNGKTWVFNLRKGVRFHDGSAFNADAVCFSFNRQLKQDFKYRYYDFPMFKEIFNLLVQVEKLDTHRVRFHLKEPFFPFLSAMTVDCAAIVSPGAVKNLKKAFRFQPVGTGPYKLKKFEKTKRIVLERNPHYWRGKPKTDEFHTIINSNIDPLLTHFSNHRIDILNSYSISKMFAIQKLSWVETSRNISLSTTFVAFNLHKPLFQNQQIRIAFSHLWNENILKLVFQDHVIVARSIFPEGIVKGSDLTRAYPQSIKQAKAILKKHLINRKLAIDFVINKGFQLELQLVKMYTKNLKRAGIDVNIVRVSEADYEKRIKSGAFDLTISGWLMDFPDPHSVIQPMFSKQLRAKGFANLSGLMNKPIQAMITMASREKDKQKRNRLYLNIEKKINTAALYIPLYQDTNLVLFNKKRIHLENNALGGLDFYLTRIK